MLRAQLQKDHRDKIAQLRLMQFAEGIMRSKNDNKDYWQTDFFEMFYDTTPKNTQTAEEIRRELQEDVRKRGGTP